MSVESLGSQSVSTAGAQNVLDIFSRVIQENKKTGMDRA